MAAIGQPLTAPEAGWQRFDDAKVFPWAVGYSQYTNASSYAGTNIGTLTTNSLVFYFKGTKIRLIGDYRDGYRTTDVRVKIDGVEESFSQLAPSGTGWIYQILNYQKTGLADMIHKVEIVANGVNVSTSYVIDAIDIDDNGSDLNQRYTGQKTLYDYIRNVPMPDGDHSLDVNGVPIDIEMYNFNTDVKYSSTPTLGNTTADQRMLVLNYKGNLTIDAGVVITPQVRKKGMTIFTAGTLTNNGTISMTDRGSNAAGQNIYLYQLYNGALEMVPAAGAAGRNSYYMNPVAFDPDATGIKGVNRQTGGGGGGFGWNNSAQAALTIPQTGAGTSYSGGAGNGAAIHSGTGITASSPTTGASGRAGGNGWYYEQAATSTTKVLALPGAGVTAGVPANYGGVTYTVTDDGVGAGGLLIVYAKAINNTGTIESKGHKGMSVAATFTGNTYSDVGGGGGSGGGSINLCYTDSYNNTGVVTAAGGGRTTNTIASGTNPWLYQGWAGGDGTVTASRISVVKYLIQDGTNIKTYAAGSYTTIGTAPATEAMFTQYGMPDISVIGSAGWGTLTSPTPSVLAYMDQTATPPNAFVATAVPNPKLILPTSDIRTQRFTTMTSVSLTSTATGGGVIRLIASNDKGLTWKTWNGTSWVNIDITNLATVKANGMTPSTLNAITSAQWLQLVGSGSFITPLRFGYYLEMTASTDTALTDLITVTASMQGTWGVAVPGTDYKYSYLGTQTLQIKILSNGDFKVNY